MTRTAAAIISLLLFISCVPNTRFVMPEYEGKQLTGGTLAMAPVRTSDLVIMNSDDITDDLGKGDPAEVYLDFFRPLFLRSLRANSYFKKIEFRPYKGDVKLERTSFNLEKGAVMYANVPAAGQSVAFDSVDADYVLFLGAIVISRFAGAAGNWMPGPNGGSFTGGKSPALVHQTSYVIWDNKKGKVVAYGTVEVSSSVMFAMTKGTWENAVGALGGLILEKTPFCRAFVGVE